MTQTEARVAAPPASTARQERLRIEIQALRAIAVTLVLVYHLWPHRLTGGYIGVDIFFVISGFLITSHLMREVHRSGGISLAAFWARRARRLLPASLLVLIVVALATVLLIPDTYWHQYMTEIGASALYVENWLLASNAVDYLAAQNSASPVQHFWSLSAEEQFYLIWPVLILAASLMTRRRSRRARTTVVVATLGTVTLASFVASVIWTSQMPATSYFVTPTRMWEFGAGGLLALVPLNSPFLGGLGALGGSLLSWVALATIGGAALLLTSASAFPGALALVPVLGALAVIIAGNPQHALSPTRLARLKPVQTLGDLSYSVYLWHWPLIVLTPLVLGRPLIAPYKLAIIALSVLLAYATKAVVEDPFRFSNPLVRARPRWTIAATVAMALVIVAGCAAPVLVLDNRNATEAQRIVTATTSSCFGAAALEASNACKDIYAVKNSMTPAFAKSDTNKVVDPHGGYQCEVPRGDSAIRNCVLGATHGAKRTIAMLGDSHSMHFMVALRSIATKHDWQVVTYFKSACSATGASDVVLQSRPDDQGPCARWGADAIAKIAASPQIDTVIFSNESSTYLQQNGAAAIGPAPYQAAWARLAAAGKKVLVIADVPHTNGTDIPDCLAAAGANASACNNPLPGAEPPDAMAKAAAGMKGRGVSLLDLTDQFCRAGVCHARIGRVIVYSDSSHLTNTYALTLAPSIQRALTKS